MRIGFDLHGVLDSYPTKFKAIIKLLEKTDITFAIVSGPPREKIEEELTKLGFEWSDFYDIYSVVDYLYNDGVEFDETDPDNLWCDDNIWWDSKARICQQHDIDFLVDDSLKYKPAFKLTKSEFIHVSEIVGKCKE